ncbi:hypothetical protein [Streptomyces aidingensis]|uniref:Uncharacterized protein n=1 Tax=Streptomyces aidingensis TaxID=910347 RepID=A0A1I1PV53_9ACTN|nr:hypothetical protein [Streptomyces aidingensis]SFD13729.1 hypothetical protein SAMN05421773_11073 [Streptomyces aidingensis]
MTTPPTTEPAAAPRCVACNRRLHPTQATRWACDDCETQAREHLGDIPRYYRAVTTAPVALGSNWGAALGTTIPGSRTPPGFDPGTADLASHDPVGILPALHQAVQDWVRAARDTGTALEPPAGPPSPLARVAVYCRWLRWHLNWACGNVPDIDRLLRAAADAHRQLRPRATGERPERVIWRACPCGGRIGWRLSKDRYRCAVCGTAYTRDTARDLPPAPRTRAAAVDVGMTEIPVSDIPLCSDLYDFWPYARPGWSAPWRLLDQ